MDYTGKGWLSGKKNSFTATLAHDSDPVKILYTIDGQWTGDFSIKDPRSKREVESYHVRQYRVCPLTVAPVEEQGELESRRAWKKVADAIERGDYEATGTEKSKIENAQRELRKREREEGREWERRYFSKVEREEKFVKLAERAGGVLVEAEKTGGVWVFDKEKYLKLKEGEGQA